MYNILHIRRLVWTVHCLRRGQLFFHQTTNTEQRPNVEDTKAVIGAILYHHRRL